MFRLVEKWNSGSAIAADLREGHTKALEKEEAHFRIAVAEDEVDVRIGNEATSLTTIAGTLTMGTTAFVNNSGVVQVATQGTIDHDSLANFVANEHIDWTGDVSASSVIHTNNITDLHGAGVDGSANQLLTDDGDGNVGAGDVINYTIKVENKGNVRLTGLTVSDTLTDGNSSCLGKRSKKT